LISLGLNAAEQREFHEVLAGSHSTDVVVRVLSLNRAYLADVTGQLFDGQVNIDADADITRTCTLSLRDPGRSLLWDTSSPNDAALFVDRLVQIIYVVRAPYPSVKSWSVPIFTGPVTKVSRTADIINLEASGMEHLISPPTVAWFAKTYGKGMKKTTLVRLLLSELGGETKFSIPDWAETTAAPVTTVFNSNLWAVAKRVVGSRAVNHLFYDGRGVCVLRKTPSASVFAFRTGTGGTIISEPQVSYDMSTVANTVRVVGATPAKAKRPVVGTASAPRTHPLSSAALGRNGKPRVILAELADDHLKTTAQATSLARAHLETILRESVEVTFDAMVIPHLEPEDVYTVNTPTLGFNGRLKKMTIPLKGGPMTVGYNARRSANKARIRAR
jgi:hypothetical protein